MLNLHRVKLPQIITKEKEVKRLEKYNMKKGWKSKLALTHYLQIRALSWC